jgi:hypothetical protein
MVLTNPWEPFYTLTVQAGINSLTGDCIGPFDDQGAALLICSGIKSGVKSLTYVWLLIKIISIFNPAIV